MTPHHLKLPLANATPALLTLPHPLTARALQALEQALVANLGMLRRDLCSADQAAHPADEPSLHADAGDLEYRSWMPDAGALEYASWAAQLQTTRRCRPRCTNAWAAPPAWRP
jgi:hypothetical protein